MVSRNFLKTVFSLLCVFALLLGCVSTVSANYDDVMFDLTSLGVLDGIEVNADLNANITREEFSQLVVNLLGYDEVASTFEDPGVFTDISTSEYKGAINLLYDLKIVSGTGTNTFSPEQPLTYPQVGKFMVNILGYSKVVNSNNIYAYSMLAGSIGVFENVDSSKEYVSWKDALIIAHNALDIDLMTRDFGMIGDNYHVVEGKTLRTSLSTTTGMRVQKLKGILTADATTYLYEAHANMKSTQIEVNGKVYNCNFEVPSDLVGMEVHFYLEETENGDIVTSIAPTEKNLVTKISLDKIDNATAEKVEYYENDDKKSSVRVNEHAKVIYNGRWDMNLTYADIDDFDNGYARLIDNDEDEIVDVIFVYEFTDAIVERIYAETKQVFFANNQLVYGARYISLDEEEDDIIANVINSEGNTVAFEEIKEDDIISIAKSKDGQVINMVVSNKVVTGVVNEIDDYSIVIDSDVFDYVVKPNVKLGDHVDAYVNFMGKVFYVEKTKAEYNYAYIMDAQQKTGISGTVKVSLIMPGYISETSTVSFDEEGSSASTKELFFRNNSKVIYELANKVKVNGSTVKAADAISLIEGEIVSYTLDSNDKISKIDLIDVFNNDTAKKKYNENGKTFSSTATDGFGISESETMSICIPTNTDASDDDLLVAVKLTHGSEYNLLAYDVDENSSIAGLAVITAEMRSGVAGSISPVNSSIAAMKKVSMVLDENGNEVIRVHMITKDGEKSYAVSPLMPTAVQNRFMSMKKGDIFYYETIAGTDELRNCQLLQSVDNYEGTGRYNVGQPNELCIGKVVDCRYNYVSASKNRWTDCVSIDCGSEVAKYEIFKTGTPVIFLIDEMGNATLGTFDDIQCGNTIYVGTVYTNIRVVAVRK
ncbi:MAG: S-layer homology domain-containing protein [Clostridia bacterium]|nr:S-layer homology domain-containing protein [Clostridia bacterium]